VLRELLEAVGSAPTGVNARQTLFTMVADKEVTRAIREEIYQRLTPVVDRDSDQYMMRFLRRALKMRQEKGSDPILRHAPHLIIASAPPTCPTPVQDCLIALSTFDLLAQAMGLGTLWNGVLSWTVNELLPDLKARMAIPEEHVIGFAMVFGMPEVKYWRTVQRGPAKVNYVAAWKETG
jgi:nitroreductase